jgi:hypothetical protein
VPRTLSSFVFVVILVACGPKSGPDGPRSDVGAHAALRWVPADATYVFATTRADAGAAVLRDLAEALGIVGGFDVAEAEAELASQLAGVSPLSIDSLVEAGIDRAGGAAAFSQGLSTTLVVKLADPAAMQVKIDAARERLGGQAIGVAMHDGVEIFTMMGDRDVHTHWAIADGWIWVHWEFTAEKEADGAWFVASRKAGGAIAATPDFGWARQQAERALPGSPVIGLVRGKALVQRVAALAHDPDARACANLVPTDRVALGMTGGGDVAEGVLVVDTVGGGGALADATLAVPVGWGATRGQPAMAAEWNIDLTHIARWLGPCRDLASLANDALHQMRARGGRAFVHQLADDGLGGHGVVAVDLVDRSMIDRMLDFPGRGLLEKKQRFGALDGAHVSVPFVNIEVDYIVTKDRAFAAMGDGLLAKVVGDGSRVPGSLAAIEVRPRAISPTAWHVVLEQGLGFSRDTLRQKTIERLQRWARGLVELTRDGDLVTVRARGERK